MKYEKMMLLSLIEQQHHRNETDSEKIEDAKNISNAAKTIIRNRITNDNVILNGLWYLINRDVK